VSEKMNRGFGFGACGGIILDTDISCTNIICKRQTKKHLLCIVHVLMIVRL
jgi:hypothetical protein